MAHEIDEHGEHVVRLYREWGPVVFRRCLRLLGDQEAARDATQEVFVKLVREAGRLEDEEAMLRWVYRVATNLCLNQKRDARRRPGVSDPDAALELAPAPTPSMPEGRLAREVLERFDARTQAVAVGVLVDGLEHEEVAGILGISRKTVQRTLNRFLERSRLLLSRGET